MVTNYQFPAIRMAAVLFLSLLGACTEKEVMPKVEHSGRATAPKQEQQEQYKPGTKGEVKELTVTLPLSKKTQKVKVTVVDDLAIMEGDIILGPLVKLQGSQAVAIEEAHYRWPNSVIPYVITGGHPETADIQWAVEHINTNTNLCLVPRTTETDYIQFVTGSGCASYVGRQGGRQDILIGGCSQGSVAHEILHAAGLWHEQSREDRDLYVTINWGNIAPGREHNFNKHVEDGIDIGPYDYGSIMHYGTTGFTSTGGNTIDINMPPGLPTTTIGQRNGLSENDIRAINFMYAQGTCKEDCLPFNPANVSIQQHGNLWLVVDGNHSLFSAPNYTEAKTIYQIIKYYNLNQSCFVGRPNPSFQYLLKDSSSPVGAMPGEDCLPFEPSRLRIVDEGSQYLMTDGTSRMFVFPNRAEAELSLNMIRKYGFTYTGYVGRPGASLQYMRK